MADDASWTDLEEVRPDLVEAEPIRHGMVLAGRYAVEKIIGRGGSGVVVRAHDRDLRQEVAIKIVRVELAGQRVWAGRLAREVKLARQIHHPHVCRVFDFEQAEGRAFLVMELADNGTLRDELRSGALAARPLAARIADARAVASALAAIHAAGIVHRDLTPQNLLRMADGRLVVSDFGLATDASESTSIHGGTVAYMAPEVLRGGKSSFASDIWALGVVMHELVFGVKPRWSDASSPEMLAPEIGRKLSKEERAVLDACRACTVKEPARRIAHGDEAGRLLTELRHWWSRPRAALPRQIIWAAWLAVAAAVGIAVGEARRTRPDARMPSSAAEAPLIIPTGQPADWTDLATVIAEVPDRIHCARLLPDQRTIRIVWGTPTRAEDVDTVTRRRAPSPLVPAAYAEGCPDVSGDGKRLVYQGHAPDGRAVAFVSEHADGSDATPIVPTAEPSMSSEPTWLADGQTFSVDIDSKHMGIFAVPTRRLHVLPEVSPSFVTTFRWTVEDRVFVAAATAAHEMTMAAISSPALREELRFRLPELALDIRSRGALLYYASGRGRGADIVELDPVHGRARSIGYVPRQFVRFPLFASGGMAFVSIRGEARAFIRQPRGSLRPLSDDRTVNYARHCGADFIVSVNEGPDRALVKRVDADGNLVRIIGPGPDDASGTCAPDGRSWYYLRLRPTPQMFACSDAGCRTLFRGPAAYPDVSPDGTRVAFMTFDKRGPVVNWMSVNGGEVHEVSETETGCAHGWASAQTLWVSRRRGGKIVWVEVDADAANETGVSKPGSRDCSDGRGDPASPVAADLPIVYDQTSQLRLLDATYLER